MKIEELGYQVDSSIFYEKISHFEWPVFLDSVIKKISLKVAMLDSILLQQIHLLS